MKKLSLTVVVAYMLSGSAMAQSVGADAMIYFKGKIVNDTCKVVTGGLTGVQDITVNLGTIEVAAVGDTLANSSASTTTVSGTITCSVATTGLTMKLKGISGTHTLVGTPEMIKLTGDGTAGVAGGVGVQVFASTAPTTPISGEGGTLWSAPSGASASIAQPFSFGAAYVKKAGATVTVGVANAEIPYQIIYN